MPILGCLKLIFRQIGPFIVQYPCFGLHTMKLYQIHSIFASALLKGLIFLIFKKQSFIYSKESVLFPLCFLLNPTPNSSGHSAWP